MKVGAQARTYIPSLYIPHEPTYLPLLVAEWASFQRRAGQGFGHGLMVKTLFYEVEDRGSNPFLETRTHASCSWEDTVASILVG